MIGSFQQFFLLISFLVQSDDFFVKFKWNFYGILYGNLFKQMIALTAMVSYRPLSFNNNCSMIYCTEFHSPGSYSTVNNFNFFCSIDWIFNFVKMQLFMFLVCLWKSIDRHESPLGQEEGQHYRINQFNCLFSSLFLTLNQIYIYPTGNSSFSQNFHLSTWQTWSFLVGND